ncbi:alpha/beta fold hydrolase [Allorhodopirellula solitaria]|uniref:Putative carboxylesterase nap n=1 Tax=Allorhodopirellula solitaria TaxID=2527987 RepID=A0A5C5XVJ8_9BACT|nr:alpha/beta hydrolase [Allorhodopirellula solitaria]TWT66539.1 putative carboxylesterase nap [Allorhodopirellula solitaria]
MITWRNEEARQRLERWFSRFRDRIDSPTESFEVPTRFGPNHVLVAGPPDGIPLVCLHAMRTGSSFLVSELNPILDRYRVIAPDLPGQSVRGLQTRLPLSDSSHVDWLADILNELDLGSTKLFGVSWGGFVARQFATNLPDRVEKLALLVPAGIANGSHLKGLTKMALPMLRYQLWRTDNNLRRLLVPIFTSWDEEWTGYTGDAVLDMPFDYRIPPVASDQDLQDLTMPVLALGGSEDISFPGVEVVRRICAIAPRAQGHVIQDCKHCPPATSDFRTWLANRLAAFFGNTKDGEPCESE